MSNSLLTIDMITRKSLEILENNLVLTRNVNRAYDDSFAVEGAKIGSTLRVRLPDRALVTDGAALQVQDDNEQYTTLAVSSQKHIGINFTSAELTMQLDDFAERVLKPRISQLASTIDADVAYYLGANPKEADRISRLSPLIQAKEIGRIEANLTSNPPVKKTSSAPAPIAPVTARGGNSANFDTTDPRSIKSMSTSEWIAAERARQIKNAESKDKYR